MSRLLPFLSLEGVIDAASILEQIELQIAQVKEEAFSRKEILDKMEKWIAACEEECWLEEYNRVGLLDLHCEVLYKYTSPLIISFNYCPG